MRSLATVRTIGALLVFITGWAMNGCSTYTKNEALSQNATFPTGEDSADFLDRISDVEVMDMNNALHGLCLLLEGKDEFSDFQARVDMLKRKGIIASDWPFSANQPLTKGRLAYLAYQASGIKEKGVVLSLFGPSQRYCLRELQYRGMMAPGGESMRVTGMEFAAVITRADTYKRTGLFPNEVGQPE